MLGRCFDRLNVHLSSLKQINRFELIVQMRDYYVNMLIYDYKEVIKTAVHSRLTSGLWKYIISSPLETNRSQFVEFNT